MTLDEYVDLNKIYKSFIIEFPCDINLFYDHYLVTDYITNYVNFDVIEYVKMLDVPFQMSYQKDKSQWTPTVKCFYIGDEIYCKNAIDEDQYLLDEFDQFNIDKVNMFKLMRAI